MITIEDIRKNSFSHPLGGKSVILRDEKIEISIVGGRRGLYGDFENTFELAVKDKNTREFVTKTFLGSNDDVCGWMTIDEIVETCNKLLSDDFQFFTGEKKVGGGTY